MVKAALLAREKRLEECGALLQHYATQVRRWPKATLLGTVLSY